MCIICDLIKSWILEGIHKYCVTSIPGNLDHFWENSQSVLILKIRQLHQVYLSNLWIERDRAKFVKMASSVRTPLEEQIREENQPFSEQRHFLSNFRTGRNEQPTRFTKASRILLKLVSQSSGLWKPSKCNICVCIIFGLICLYQLIYDLYIVIGCEGFDCGFVNNVTEAKNVHKSDRATENTVYTLGSLGAATSYICLVVSLLMLGSKNKKALEPCQAIKDLSETQHCILCTSISFCFLCFASSVAVFYTIVCLSQPKGKFFYILLTGVGGQFIAQWASIVGVHVFAVSSLALGKLNVYRNSTLCRLL